MPDLTSLIPAVVISFATLILRLTGMPSVMAKPLVLLLSFLYALAPLFGLTPGQVDAGSAFATTLITAFLTMGGYDTAKPVVSSLIGQINSSPGTPVPPAPPTTGAPS